MSQLDSRPHRGNGGDWWVTASHLTRMSRFGWENNWRSGAYRSREQERDISPLFYFLVSANIKLSFIIDVREPWISLLFITPGQKTRLTDVRHLCSELILSNAVFKHFKEMTSLVLSPDYNSSLIQVTALPSHCDCIIIHCLYFYRRSFSLTVSESSIFILLIEINKKSKKFQHSTLSKRPLH